MPKRSMRFCAIAIVAMLMVAPSISLAKDKDKHDNDDGNSGVTSLLQQLSAKLFPASGGKTRILFPYVTNTAGFDTGLAISNTGTDSTGTIGTAGTITFHFYGSGAPLTPYVTATVQPGTTYTDLASVRAPGFNGYVEADCNFPLAHGFGFLSDVGARNLAATIPALILPPVRSPSVVESLGQ